MSKKLTIAIDGPAASGKTTLSKSLADRFGYLYFDTGALYRAVTWKALEQNVSIEDGDALAALAQKISIDLLPASKEDGRLYDVVVDGEDRSWMIRMPEVDANVSQVSAYAGVREALRDQQRRIGKRGGVVMAGRDIGTVVFPEAEVKIYLDASLEERARRRFQELQTHGEETLYAEIEKSMRERDEVDANRAIAPLRTARDAYRVSSDSKTAQEVLAKAVFIVNKVKQRMEAAALSRSRPFRYLFPVPLSIRLRRSILRGIFRLIFRVLCRIELRGFENIPKEGGYVIAHNHISLFEPPLVIAFWPVAPEGIAGADVFHRPGQKIMVRAYHAIPVHRDEYDRKVVDTMMQVLAAGKPLMIAPEGGRGHVAALRKSHAGVAYLVDRAKVPVVPVGIVGTSDDMLSRALRGQRPQIEMNIGEPFRPPSIESKGEKRRMERRRNADMIMERIAALLPENYRGVYR